MKTDKKVNMKPSKKFRMLLIILIGALFFVIALIISAFQVLKLAQEYGIIDVAEEQIEMDGWNDIDKETMDMINSNNQPMSAIESIQIEEKKKTNGCLTAFLIVLGIFILFVALCYYSLYQVGMFLDMDETESVTTTTTVRPIDMRGWNDAEDLLKPLRERQKNSKYKETTPTSSRSPEEINAEIEAVLG